MVSDLAQQAAVKQALQQLDPEGVKLDTRSGETMTVSANTDRKVTIYSMLTGEPRTILYIDAARVLAKKLSDGRPAFWVEGMPGEPPTYLKGDLKCMLHPEFDETDGPSEVDRKWVDSIGLSGRTCNMSAPDKPNRADFRSVFDRDDHMRTKHRREWATIQAAAERERLRREAEERRADREAMMALAGRRETPNGEDSKSRSERR